MDTSVLYLPHDKEAIEEAYINAHVSNVIRNDSNNEILYKIRHESLYAAFVLSDNNDKLDKTNIFQYINNLNDLIEDVDYYNEKIYSTVKFKENYYTYGICLLNKWCEFNDIIINKTITKEFSNYLSESIYSYHETIIKFHDAMHNLNKNLLIFISISDHNPTLDIEQMISILDDDIRNLFLNLPDNNVQLGYLINEALIYKCIEKMDNNSSLYKLYKSGSRFSKQQLARSCINIGYVADDNNIIVPKPVKTNLLKGQTENDFFIGSPGARKGIVDKADHTPNSGHMERALTMALSILDIVENDCKSEIYLETTILNKKHCKTLVDKFFKFDKNDPLSLMTYDIAINNIGRKIYLRSPITCQTKDFRLCKMCFGNRYYPTEHVGITAAQCLSERLTQLIMRSFHTSGSATLDVDKELLNFIKDHLIKLDNKESKIILTFDTNIINEKIKSINSFVNIDNNCVIFEEFNKDVRNKDTIQLMMKVKSLLKTQKNPELKPNQFYEEMMKLILEVETPNSSFVEMLFANMFCCNAERTEFWRYNTEKDVVVKLGDKNLADYINKSLFALFRPNKKTLRYIDDIKTKEKLTIYEKIWLGKII